MTVLDFPISSARGISFPARLDAGPKIQLYADPDTLSLQPGDIISCSVTLTASDFLRGEYIDYYQSKGIYLLGYAQDELTLLHQGDPFSPQYFSQRVAKLLKEELVRLFPSDVSGFFTALVTGDKSTLPVGMYAAFQRAGLSHIIAVSGLHIGFLAGMLFFFLGRHTWKASLISILFMFFFAALAGNTPSALRAAYMSSLLMSAPLFGRESDKATTLSLVLLLSLLPCPYAAASVSLQLSFAAVAGIYLLDEELTSRWIKSLPKWDKPAGKFLRYFLSLLSCGTAVTLGALLFTLPLAAFHFHTVSIIGPVSNLFTLWAVSVSFLGGLVVALLGLISFPLASGLAWIMAWPARWILWVAKCISALPFSSISLLSGYLLLWFVIAYIIFLLWFLSRGRMRPVIPCSALILTLCAALVTYTWPTVTNALSVTALDVGQGAATLFFSKGHTILVDCGGNGADDPGDVAADYIQSLGSSHLDTLVLTHYHSDHACGVPELLSRLNVSTIILPDVTPEDPLRKEILSLAANYNCNVEMLVNDAHIEFGDASMEIYAPLGDGGANEEGLSVLCSAGDYDILVTGDMNDVVERRLIKYKSLPDIELLMVGHHGSKYATSEELLLALTPEHAVISSGYNHYGHPSLEALERLGAAGCAIYRTDLMGTITFTIKGD